MTGIGLLNAIFLVLPSLIGSYLGYYSWQRRTMTGATSFATMMLICVCWCLTSALVVLNKNPDVARFWLNSMLAVTPFLPVSVFAAAAQTTGRTELVRPLRLGLLLIVPSLTAILSLTSASQSWYIYDVGLVKNGGQNIGWINNFGPWGVVHLSYSYALIIFAIVLLAQQFIKAHFRTYRMRLLLILLGLALPFLVNVYNIVATDAHYFITPIMFNVSAPLLFWVLFRYRLFELVPIAREQAFEQMNDAVLIVNEDNYLVDINPPAAALIHQDASKLILKSLREAFPDFDPALMHTMENAVEPQSLQTQYANHYFDLRVTPIFHDGRQSGKIIILRNVTEQRLAQLRTHRMELERERVSTLSDFVQAASHEFRTPLSIIKTSAYFVNRTDDPAKRLAKTEQIDTQVDRLTLLVDGLLTIVKLNTVFELPLEPLDVNALIEALRQKWFPAVHAKSLTMTIKATPDLPRIKGNEDYLSAALDAVIDNAIRYTPEGGTITLCAAQQDSSLVVTVKDSGIGIPPEHLPYIFDVLYRVDQARTTAGFGTGLAIASRVLDLHNGSIRASSEPGAGTTIQMTLPILDAAKPDALQAS